jgi:hypothetical protein
MFNQDSLERTKFFLEYSKHYGFLCCKTQPVKAKLTIRRRAYAIGDKILFDFKVDNQSSRFVQKLRVSLVKTTKFIVKDKKKVTSKILSEIEHEHLIEPTTEYEWKGGEIEVPFTQPSSVSSSKIVDITYGVYFEVISSFFTINLKKGILVTIGLKSLSNNNEGEQGNKPGFQVEHLQSNPFKIRMS